jgi:hypothetical protein
MNGEKILIIGFGKMGLSHFKSLYQKNYIIHILEKKKNNNIKDLQNNKFLNKKIFILKKMPEKRKYLLTISSTTSRERYSSISQFLKKNKTKFLLLEKFTFSKIDQFNKFKNQFSKKTMTFINSWAYIVAKKLSLKKIDKFHLVCKINEGNLLANITHFIHFFGYLNNKNQDITLNKSQYHIIPNSNRSSYNEISGAINFEDSAKNKLTLITKKRMKDPMVMTIYNRSYKIYRKIYLKKNLKFYYRLKNKKIFFQFPLSKITTAAFLKKCIVNNFNYMPSFVDDYIFSKFILKKLKLKIC